MGWDFEDKGEIIIKFRNATIPRSPGGANKCPPSKIIKCRSEGMCWPLTQFVHQRGRPPYLGLKCTRGKTTNGHRIPSFHNGFQVAMYEK